VVVQRESLHVRLPVATVERVREAAHRLRRERQEIADEALREWLDKHGL
jgi:predicted transcriptional regulator